MSRSAIRVPYVFNFVYRLTDPRISDIKRVRYIGVTTDLNKRFFKHLQCSPTDNAAKNAWIKELQEEGLTPNMEIEQTFKTWKGDRIEPLKVEAKWIHYYSDLGVDLLNLQIRERETIDVDEDDEALQILGQAGFDIHDPKTKELWKLLGGNPAFGDF